MKTPYDRLAKIYTNCTGHMTKMATTPVYGKNPLNILFCGTKRPMAWDLVCIIGDVGPTRFAQMMNLGWPWPTLWQGQIWFLMHLYENNLEMFLAHLSRRLRGELLVYQWLWRPSSFVRPSSVVRPSTFSNIFSSETTWPIELKFHMKTP